MPFLFITEASSWPKHWPAGSGLTYKPNDQQFTQKQEKICHFIQDGNPEMLKEQKEGIFGSRAEVFHPHHNVGVSVQELYDLLQTPEAALQAAQQELCKLILGSWRFVVQILQQNPDELNDGEDEGAKRQSPCHKPERSPQRRKHREGRNVVRLGKGPVVRGKGSIGTPEEEEDVVELLFLWRVREILENTKEEPGTEFQATPSTVKGKTGGQVTHMRIQYQE
uniref:Uncharacterized protein n=1 Tax=Oryzias latipes TaxID=8090 RepID=A0A3B3HBU4_ORYLA